MLSDLKKDLMRDEGLRYDAYRDSLGYWTIGIGHLLGVGPTPRMTNLTDDEVDALFEYDAKVAENRCRELFPNWVLIPFVRRDALINMSFNLGNRFRGFSKMIAAVNAAANTVLDEAWLEVGRQMMDSVWAKQVGQRATRLHYMITMNARMS